MVLNKVSQATLVSAPHIDEQIRSRLVTHDVRYTKGRRRVITALAGAEGPRSAAELFDHMKEPLPLSSIYRSLAVLSDAGVVAPHHGAKGVTRYELAEWLQGHHHHLVCVRCGTVDDVELSGSLESTLEAVVADVVAGNGFSPSGHALEIDGICAACA